MEKHLFARYSEPFLKRIREDIRQLDKRQENWLYAQSSASLQWSRPSPNECPVYDTKQSDGEVPVMLEL